jgi:hypothetical protein
VEAWDAEIAETVYLVCPEKAALCTGIGIAHCSPGHFLLDVVLAQHNRLGAWWIAIPLVVAETFSLGESVPYGATMWNARKGPHRHPHPGARRSTLHRHLQRAARHCPEDARNMRV